MTTQHVGTPTLLDLFDGLICDDFRFCKQGIGADYCISLPYILDVPEGAAKIPLFVPGPGGLTAITTPNTPKLALHLNFKCTVSGLHKDDRLNLAIIAFHITARRARGQEMTDEHGPSVLTADDSIHINRNTGWRREENLDNLLREPNGLSREDLFHVLNEKFSQGSMKHLVTEWKKKIEIEAQHATMISNITWDNSDKTCN